MNFCLFSVQVSIDALVYHCHQFRCKFVCFTLEDDATTTTVGSSISTGSKPNTFVIMMSAAHKIVLPHLTKVVVNIHWEVIMLFIINCWICWRIWSLGGLQILFELLVRNLLKHSQIVFGQWIHIMNNLLQEPV